MRAALVDEEFEHISRDTSSWSPATDLCSACPRAPSPFISCCLFTINSLLKARKAHTRLHRDGCSTILFRFRNDIYLIVLCFRPKTSPWTLGNHSGDFIHSILFILHLVHKILINNEKSSKRQAVKQKRKITAAVLRLNKGHKARRSMVCLQFTGHCSFYIR